MKRLMAAALILSAIGALGVWLGLPVYAENQFRKSLDTWAASRPGDRAGYAVAKLDYWAGRATVGSLTEVIEVDAADAPSLFLVTFSDLVIEDYDFAAAERAVSGHAGKGDRIARQIAWGTIQIENEAGTLNAVGGEGFIKDFAASSIDPLRPLGARGVSFQAFAQSPIDVTTTGGEAELSGRLGASSVIGYNGNGFRNLSVGETRVELAAEEAGGLVVGWTGIEAAGLLRGEPTTLATLEYQGFYTEFALQADSAGGEVVDGLSRKPVKGRIGWDAYRAEDIRLDEDIVGLYRTLIGMLSNKDVDPDAEVLAALAESALVLLERAEALRTGAARVIVENMIFEVEDVQSLSVARLEASDIEGLRFGKMEVFDQKQIDALGNRSELERSSMTGFDLSEIPSYLRMILGQPVTVDSLDKAATFYRQNTIAAAIPAIDFGVWESVGQTITTMDGQNIAIDRVAMDSWKADAEGDIRLAIAFEGIALDLKGLPADDANAQMGLAILESQGLEQLKIDMIFDLDFSPSRGELELRRLSFGVDQLVDLDVSAKVSGLDVEQIRHLPEEARASALMAAVVRQVELTLADDGGRDIAFALMGGQSGASKEEMAQAMAQQAQGMFASLGSSRALDIGDVVGAFVLNGGVLKLKAAALEPLPIVQLMLAMQTEGLGAVLDLLQMQAEHQPPG